MSLEKGCEIAVKTCMDISEDDDVVIVADEGSEAIGLCLRNKALEITPHVRYFKLEVYGDRPLDHLPNVIKEPVHDATATFWTGKSIKGELETIRKPFLNAALIGGRHAHMVDITKKIMETGMAVDYQEVDRFTKDLHSSIKDINQIRVTNEVGTDFTAKFSGIKWGISTGINETPGHWTNLPSGEIFTAPTEMKGKVVVDGVLGEYFGYNYSHSDLQETPIKIDIETKERPLAVDLSCDDHELLAELEDYLSLHECSSFVGEVGLGTNLFLKELIGNMLQDEKYPGIHVAFGDPITSETYAGWTCPEHLDMVLTNCNVWIDDEKIMEDGKYIVEF